MPDRNSAPIFGRGFVAPSTAAARPVIGRVGAPLVTAAPPPAPLGAGLAMADAILRQYGRPSRELVDPELEPLDPDINDPDPLYDVEPEDPSHDSHFARQDDNEEDDEEERQAEDDEEDEEDMPRDEDTGRFVERQDDEEEDDDEERALTRQDDDEDEEPTPEDEPAASAHPQGRDVDITIVDVDEENEFGDDEEEPFP